MRRTLLLAPVIMAAMLIGARAEAGALIADGSFDAPDYLGSLWQLGLNHGAAATIKFREGALCIDVTNIGTGTTPLTDIGLFQQGWWNSTTLPIVASASVSYTAQFTAWTENTTNPQQIQYSVGELPAPYTTSIGEPTGPIMGTSTSTHSVLSFPGVASLAGSATNPEALKIFVGGGVAPYSVCIDDAILDTVTNGEYRPVGVFVNQVGYPTGAPKYALVTVPSTEAGTLRSWALMFDDPTNGWTQVTTGTTATSATTDTTSGLTLQQLSFDSITTPGTYRIDVDQDGSTWSSFSFPIGASLYSALAKDAVRFFYYQSERDLVEPYVAQDRWARTSGFTSNTGDANACVYTTNWTTCTSRMDVSGGWYDAGDYGKYVVNGGIAVWTLLNLFERAQQRCNTGSVTTLGVGGLNLPADATDTALPDYLAAVKFELDWFKKMQDANGMVHHKVAAFNWSPFGPPGKDTQQRYVLPVTTAATLNFAATMAQAFRVFKMFPDAASQSYAVDCLARAEAAWTAALANPAVYADTSASTTTGWNTGSGSYSDNNVTDEFAWAAAELYLATNDATTYGSHLTTISGTACPNTNGSFSWGVTGSLGTLSLATVNSPTNAYYASARTAAKACADGIVANMNAASNGFRSPVSHFVWGSNSDVLNNAIWLAYAYDSTGTASYAQRTFDALSFVLGRNGLAKSFVSGHGENPLQNPHHRFFSYEYSTALTGSGAGPKVPPGFIAGGPNGDRPGDDPYITAAVTANVTGTGAMSYADNIGSYSTNEVALNWNSPLVWVSSFVDQWSSGVANACTTSGDAGVADASDAAPPIDSAVAADSELDTGLDTGSIVDSSVLDSAVDATAGDSSVDAVTSSDVVAPSDTNVASDSNVASDTGTASTDAAAATETSSDDATSGDAIADADGGVAVTTSKGGCGCRIEGESSPGGPLQIFAIGGLLVAMRRRRRPHDA